MTDVIPSFQGRYSLQLDLDAQQLEKYGIGNGNQYHKYISSISHYSLFLQFISSLVRCEVAVHESTVYEVRQQLKCLRNKMLRFQFQCTQVLVSYKSSNGSI